ncbi:MAG TPA: hypothetical protein VGB82_10115 [Alphaproteobacteria bacterium]
MPVTMILLLLLGSLQQGAAADSQTQRGVVRDQTGAVLRGAQVELADESGGTGRDDYRTGQTNARPAGVARNTLQGPGSAPSRPALVAGISDRIGKGEDAAAWSVGVDAFNVISIG